MYALLAWITIETNIHREEEPPSTVHQAKQATRFRAARSPSKQTLLPLWHYRPAITVTDMLVTKKTLAQEVNENSDFTNRGGAKYKNVYSIIKLSDSQPYPRSTMDG
jgi:hypothetical protein